MTFADKLRELRGKIKTEENALRRYARIQELDAFLANHAAEIEALVRAAEKIVQLEQKKDEAKIANQGQALDGFSLLANYRAYTKSLKELIHRLDKTESAV